VFSKPSIKQLLGQYELVQLYTDKVPPQFESTTSAAENRALQNDKFGTAQLPLYVILKPTGHGKFEEVGRYEEGKINDLAGFVQFLEQPLKANARLAAAAR
jgi:hypothetical protein